MRIHVEDGLAIGWIIHGFKPGERSACFAIKATYQLQSDAPSIPATEGTPLSGDTYTGADSNSSLLYPSDFVPLKPRADIVVLATAYAPGGQALHWLPVRLKVGPIDKTLVVFGPRTRRPDVSGISLAAEPEAFVALPITYENAIGGVKSNTNPVGRSIDSDALPQIEDPRWIDTSPLEDADPAGFGPLAPSWAPRAELIRAHDACCLKAPWFPESFDYGYFNAAPLDQQVAGYLRGDEELLFENLHRQHATYRTYLPGLRTRCFLQKRDESGHLHFHEVPLTLDTLWIDLNAEKMILVWRGRVPVRSISLKEIEQVMAWTEPLAAPPRAASYCAIFLSERQRAEDAVFEVQPPVASAGADEGSTGTQFDNILAEFERDMAEAEEELADAGGGPTSETPIPDRRPAAQSDGRIHLTQAEVLAYLADGRSLERTMFDRVDLRGRSLKNVSLRDSVLQMVDLTGANLAGADLSNATLCAVNLERVFAKAAVLRDATFVDCQASGAAFVECDLRDVTIRTSSFVAAYWVESNLENATFAECDLTRARFDRTRLVKVVALGAAFNDCDFAAADLTAANFMGCDFSGAAFAHSVLKSSMFNESTFARARLADALMDRADFALCNLTGIGDLPQDCGGLSFSRANLSGLDLSGKDFQGTDLTDAQLRDATLTHANLAGISGSRADFSGAELDAVNVTAARLDEALLTDASLRACKFTVGCNIKDADFRNADLTQCDLSTAILEGCDFTGATLADAELVGVRARLADFTGANLQRAVVTRSDMRQAVFRAATLGLATFDNSDLSETIFVEAGVAQANFVGTKLLYADFSDANVQGADFTSADLTGAILHGVNHESATWDYANMQGVRSDCGQDFNSKALFVAESRGLR